MSRTRAVVGGVLGLIYPGLGHLYLRAWVRGLAWIGMAVATASLIIPGSAVTAAQSGGIEGLLAASRSLPTTAVIALTAVRALSCLDAVWIALRPRGGATEGPTCPNCGGELDAEISFCPWCTTRLEESEFDVEGATSAEAEA